MICSLGELSRMNPSVTDFTEDGHCSGCGSCCSDFLAVSKEEIERIRVYVVNHHLKEHITLVNPGIFMDCTCPFRDNVHKKCDIYPVRPQICRCFQCDQEMELINSNKALFQQRNQTISMRTEFFGRANNGIIANMINASMKLK